MKNFVLFVATLSFLSTTALAIESISSCKLENIPAHRNGSNSGTYVVAGTQSTGTEARSQFQTLSQSPRASVQLGTDSLGQFYFEEVTLYAPISSTELVEGFRESTENVGTKEICVHTFADVYKCETHCLYTKSSIDNR